LRWIRNAPIPELILKIDSARICRTKPLDGLSRTSWARDIKGLFVITVFGKSGKTRLDNTIEG
jgi:hypothetical protein